MHPFTHVLMGWTVAELAPLDRRDRAIVTWAGVIPDLDALGVIADVLTEKTHHRTFWYDDYHHVLMHNLGFGLFLLILALALARKRALTGALAVLSFHLHLLGDLAGSRGPDGYQWPIPYLLPFSSRWSWSWNGQWGLKAWPNVTLSILLLGLALYWAWRRGRSPVELVSGKGDAALIRTLRARFGQPS